MSGKDGRQVITGIDRILDPYAIQFPGVTAENLGARMAKAERSFVESGDLMAGLHVVSMALAHEVAVPRWASEWLRIGLMMYLNGGIGSLDEALGLKAKGRANPRRKHAEIASLKGALGRMLMLQACGATVAQAATLVARLSADFSPSTLEDRYKRGGYGSTARQARGAGLPKNLDLERYLKVYPDNPIEAAQAKDAIRKVYAKRRV